MTDNFLGGFPVFGERRDENRPVAKQKIMWTSPIGIFRISLRFHKSNKKSLYLNISKMNHYNVVKTICAYRENTDRTEYFSSFDFPLKSVGKQNK